MDKKGLELSMTVIVTLILSVMIFIGGITMVWKFFASAEDIKGGIEKQTQDQIEAMLRQGTDIVAIPINTKQVATGKEAVFGLGIKNVGEDQGFYVALSFSGIYDKGGQPLGIGTKEYIEQYWLGGFKKQGPINIQRNKYDTVPLRIRAATSIDNGQTTPKQAMVVFNVCILNPDPGDDFNCELGIPPGALYDKIRQVTIETV
jgi:hypothetical protein